MAVALFGMFGAQVLFKTPLPLLVSTKSSIVNNLPVLVPKKLRVFLPKNCDFYDPITFLLKRVLTFCVVTKLSLPNCWLPNCQSKGVTKLSLPNCCYQNVSSQIVSYQNSVPKNPPVIQVFFICLGYVYKTIDIHCMLI